MKKASVVIDFVGRELFEKKLKESEARYRLLADNCSDMIACLDIEGRYLYVSPSCFTLFGQREEELLGHKAVEFAHPEDVTLLPETIKEILDRPGVRTLTFRRRRGDGLYSWVESKVQGVRDERGTVTEIILTARDISDRHRAEEELRIAATAFEAQEGMVITHANGKILRVNSAFSEITGYTASDVAGQTTNLLKSGRHDNAFYRNMWESISNTGTWQGEIWNKRKNGEVYPEWLTITAVKATSGEISHYVGAFTDITRRKATEFEIEQLAFYDPLTRLPNRRLLRDRLRLSLAASARNKHGGALLFIDLDNFKTINDTLGHDIGDVLLQKTAERLTSCVRKNDTVARLGGDEFVVMLDNLSRNPAEAAAQARTASEKILATLSQSYALGSCVCESGPSIGVTLFSDHGENIDEIMKQADLAMYGAKTAGGGGIRFFDPEMQNAINTRSARVAKLHTAIQEKQFILHYQPQVGRSGELTGAEALLRWQHPEQGLIYPDSFIPLAEETGLIVPLGRWVLESACAQLVAWAKQENTSHLTLAINVSACQFHRADFVKQVMNTLEHSGADPRKLKLELTESMLINDIDDARAKMSEMKAQGLSFSLDDFGTGYSSLSYLKSLPLSQLKIDRTFVTDVHSDPNAAAIAKTIVFLAQSLGMAVIAEGVETEVQRQFLDSNGCSDYQGFLFSRPLPLNAFEKLLPNHPAESFELTA